jgi:murein tripeptide amidase MpaA
VHLKRTRPNQLPPGSPDPRARSQAGGRRRVVAGLTAGFVALGMTAGLTSASASDLLGAGSDQLAFSFGAKGAAGEAQIVRVHLPGRSAFEEAKAAGFDITGNVERVPDGVEADVLVTEEEMTALRALGARKVGEMAESDDDASSAMALFDAAAAAAVGEDVVQIGRVDYFTTQGQGFVAVEAKSSAGADAELTLSWDTGAGTAPASGGSAEMSAFVDSGVYLTHELQVPVDERPNRITVSSSLGGSAVGEPELWLDPVDDAAQNRPGYERDFIDGYKDPTQLYDRLEALAAEFPELTEVVELPNKTNGYQRKAQTILGATDGARAASAVVVTSNAWGHEGGNDLSVSIEAPTGADQALSVAVSGNEVTVRPATDGSGAITSTAAQVAAALSEQAGDLLTAHTYRTTGGTGVVAPVERSALSDFLSAPDYVERGEFTVRALRIGKTRDGSKPGVLITAQDHAREWVTPLVAMEAAERMLRNYDNDPVTRDTVDNTDIFIVPSNNPDGSHYSFHDFASQRKTMTNHCGPENSDPNRRNNWGVDLNRNYRVGSVFDGFTGASTVCTSGNYAGPGELSEPEAKNIIWLVENFRNIKFYMTIHSNGGQLFWQPGAYKADGRVQTPRPPYRDENWYWQAGERILSNVKAQRDTPVQPRNVGASSDVLYSSAGNVREDLYFNYGIYAFGWEIGGSTWNVEEQEWERGSFQPVWDEAHQQTLEYANGIVEMFEIAAEWGKDNTAPTSTLVQEPAHDGTRDMLVSFTTSEPASVYYTTDGSRPTFNSPVFKQDGIRGPAEQIRISSQTTIRWFSVDTKGLIEGDYKPSGSLKGFRQTTVKPALVKPTTGFEQSAYRDWTTQEQEQDLLRTLDNASDRVTVSEIGTSNEGRPIQLVEVTSPNDVPDEDKATVVFTCLQHGNEPAAREACLIQIRDLAYTTSKSDITAMDNARLLFVPTVNPDGRAANTRGNADRVDINRDHLLLETLEGKTLARLFNEEDPHIVHDLHEYSGAPGFDITYLWPRNLNVDEEVYENSRELNLDWVKKNIERSGYTTGEYAIQLKNGKPVLQTAGDDDERILRNAVGLRHSMGILVESWTGYKNQAERDNLALQRFRRVDSQVEGVDGTINMLVDPRKRTQIMEAKEAAEEYASSRWFDDKEAFFFDGADNRLPTSSSDVAITPPCGYTLTAEEAAQMAELFELHGIETTPIEGGGVRVSMAQESSPVIPLLLDSRADYSPVDAARTNAGSAACAEFARS